MNEFACMSCTLSPAEFKQAFTRGSEGSSASRRGMLYLHGPGWLKTPQLMSYLPHSQWTLQRFTHNNYGFKNMLSWLLWLFCVTNAAWRYDKCWRCSYVFLKGTPAFAQKQSGWCLTLKELNADGRQSVCERDGGTERAKRKSERVWGGKWSVNKE